MEKAHRKILPCVLLLILLSSRAYAINFGSVVRSDYAEATSDESVKFTMLFWNAEDESYITELSVQSAPEGWVVIIDPDEFVLNKTTGEEYIKLPYTDELIKTKVVSLFVRPAAGSQPGNYSVAIRAETKMSQDGESDITVTPERTLNFVVGVRGFATTEGGNSEKGMEFSSGSIETVNEMLKIGRPGSEIEISKEQFYFAITFLIIIVSFLIYKKS
jgi:uncharacterized membrane protein